METTTDENIFKLKYKTFIPILVSIIVITNTATSLIFNVTDNTDTIEYNDNRSNKKDENLSKDLKSYVDSQLLKYKLEIALKEIEELKSK